MSSTPAAPASLRSRRCRSSVLLALLLFCGALALPGAGSRASAQVQPASPSGAPGTLPSVVPSPAQNGQGTYNPQNNGQNNGQGNGQNNGSRQTGNGQNNNGQNNQNNQNNNQNNRSNNPNGTRDDNNNRDNNNDVDRSPVPVLETDFQRLVGETTGTVLPIFGANLFNGVPSTFAPVDDIPVSPDYVIGPGDEIRVELFGQISQQQNLVVGRTGSISYPDVGVLHVAGLRFGQLQPFLRQQLSRVYRNFDINVNLGQLRTIQIFVTGQARRPGAFTVSSLSTLLNALFASGGPLPQGSLRDIQVIREGQVIIHFDLYDLLLRGDKSKDIVLRPGDVIFIPVVGRQVALTGAVVNPAIFEVAPGTTVDQVIALAGGRTNTANTAQLRLERIFEASLRSIIDVNLAAGQDPTVRDGDILTVPTIQDKYKDAVTLRGNVAAPGRYVWHPGMRITDVVPNKDALITRNYYLATNAQGNPSQGGTLGSGLQIRGSGTTQQADAATQAGAVNSGVGGAGALGAALAQSTGTFAPVNDVVLNAPDVDLSYAVIERLDPRTLATILIPFNPEKLYFQGDQTQNLPLEPGDILTFFSSADIHVPSTQQTRFVRLEGEFMAPGPYSVQPGETLRQLIARAGGFTPQAYLYGSQFTRESTRRIQQQRLNEYADTLDAEISAYSARTSSGAISAQDLTAASAAQAASRETVARLRRTVPLGRIVLDFKPDSRILNDIPDIALEDGDRFTVPLTPSTVSVEGQVYSANAFLWQRGQREHDYLRHAGGPQRNADLSRIFILRADGSVYSMRYGNVAKATMFPGDTVVVPPKFNNAAFFRELVDVSSIIGQFGLGAAAVEVFR